MNLLADGEVVDSQELTAENNWQADFVELDEYSNGEEIEYTIEEEAIEKFVIESVTGNAEDGFVITNRPAKVSVGDYVWFDENKDGLQDDTDIPLEGVVLVLKDEDGQRDPTLDFGFVLVTPNPEEPEDSQDPQEASEDDDSDLPTTGEAATHTLLGAVLLVLGGFLALYDRKRSSQ